jgi:glycosyltransferase involved in cell wall biosynthesis
MSLLRARVALDAHTVGRRATGNETYIRGLLQGLAGQSSIEPVVLADPDADLPFEASPYGRRLRWRHPIPRLLLELSRPGRLWQADLLHVQYVRPPFCDVPCVTTVHDISYEHHPKLFTSRSRARMRATIPWSARHSAQVITGSEYSRTDLLDRYGLAPDRVHVTPYAADSRFRRQPTDAVAAVLRRLGLPHDYLLYVGNLQPRKNLPRLLDAFVLLHAAGHGLPLVIVGQRAWLADDVFAAVRRNRLEDCVHFTGYVAAADLPALYSGAHAFAYPSLFEGFGFPVLEALACGVPTLTSTTSSLLEVAGDGALTVDPTSTEAIADGLIRIVADQATRDRLAARGPEQAARFSWARCAELTVQVYRRALA